MSEKENKHNSELSMDDLDAVAGGAAHVVNSSRSNIKNNVSTGSTPGTTPTVTGTAAADTSMTAATLTTTP